MRTATIAAAAVWLAGCTSVPLLPALRPEERAAVDLQPPPHYTAAVHCVDPEGRQMEECWLADEAHELLAATGWIAKAPDGEPADLDVAVIVERRPLYDSPGLALVALVVPVWWTDSRGLAMTVRRADDGREVPVSTVHEGTVIFWVGAPFLNLLPDRGWNARSSRDVEHVKLQLLPLLAQ